MVLQTVVSLVLEYGVSIDTVTVTNHNIALMVGCVSDKFIVLVEIMLKHSEMNDKTINVKNKHKQTALFIACSSLNRLQKYPLFG